MDSTDKADAPERQTSPPSSPTQASDRKRRLDGESEAHEFKHRRQEEGHGPKITGRGRKGRDIGRKDYL